jgi:hypothetical protein
MTNALNILLTTKTAHMHAGASTIACSRATAGAETASVARMSSAGFDQDHNFTVLADRGAG